MISKTAQPHNLKKTTLLKASLVTGLLAVSVMTISPLVASFSQAQAQTVRTMTVSPPRVEVSLNPGESTEGVIKIINDSNETLTFDVLMQDFIVDNTQGIPNLLPPDALSNEYSASTWIGLESHQVTVPPRTRQELSYYLQVPEDARPGGHYAAVVYSPAVAETGDEGSGATVTSQIGTLFYVTVKGPIQEKADVTLFDGPRFSEYGPIGVTTQIRNMGDNHIRPRGYITVTNMFGEQAYTSPLTERNIFPGGQGVNYENEFGKKWMFGRYKAELLGSYGAQNNLPLAASFYFWVIPWKLILAIFLLIAAVVLGALYLKKNKKGPPKPESHPEQPTEPQVEQPHIIK